MANVNVCDFCNNKIDGQPRFTLGDRSFVDKHELKVKDFCSPGCRLKHLISDVDTVTREQWEEFEKLPTREAWAKAKEIRDAAHEIARKALRLQ